MRLLSNKLKYKNDWQLICFFLQSFGQKKLIWPLLYQYVFEMIAMLCVLISLPQVILVCAVAKWALKQWLESSAPCCKFHPHDSVASILVTGIKGRIAKIGKHETSPLIYNRWGWTVYPFSKMNFTTVNPVEDSCKNVKMHICRALNIAFDFFVKIQQRVSINFSSDLLFCTFCSGTWPFDSLSVCVCVCVFDSERECVCLRYKKVEYERENWVKVKYL